MRAPIKCTASKIQSKKNKKPLDNFKKICYNNGVRKQKTPKKRKEVCTMTKREMFVAIANLAEVQANPEMVEFLNHQVEMLDARKSSGKTTLTATQKANLGIKEDIISALGDLDHPVTVTELISSDERLENFKPQKISALLTQLKDEQRVVRTMDKKRALYALV